MIPSTQKKALSSTGRIIAILGILAAFAPLATDMYLPGFPQMAAYFAVPESGIEITLSIFFLGLAAGQAIYGPVIDRFGRRGPLLIGIGLYIASAMLCLLVADIKVFIALRFLQAVGGCAGMIIGRAIVTDLFDERDSARAFSSLLLVMTLAPILAPILGGFILTHAGWKAIFLFMLVFGLVCAALVWCFVPETLAQEDRRKESPIIIARTWLALITDPAFIVPALVGGLAQACMFAFITGSPTVFINIHGASAQTYGFLFALIACALIVASQINRIMLKWKSPEFLLGAALILNVVAGVMAVLTVATDSLPLLLITLWFAIGALGFIGADAAAIAMAASGRHAGSGSALIGVLQFGCAFTVSSLVAASQNGTAYPMTANIAACGVLATGIWFMTAKKVAQAVPVGKR
ncbi:multidrug effflux MFS transporter [Acetobacter sp. P1H12_c]|uniref:multidrug effflux MFS transporter n=1 Tax=Acetobacter sp. P1H12_c TaxID=2762621 RepID=UPI001C040CA7|nr:multidrug effflux MFS transporter [Acetobacter sp. P1H12_c]